MLHPTRVSLNLLLLDARGEAPASVAKDVRIALESGGRFRVRAWAGHTALSADVPGVRFVAIRRAVMLGSDCVATACSKTMAKRIARALNIHKPNREGV